MANFTLLLSRGAGFSPTIAHVIASDGSLVDQGHTFSSVSQLIEALESLEVMTAAFQIEFQALNSGIRTWISLTEAQANAFTRLAPTDRKF